MVQCGMFRSMEYCTYLLTCTFPSQVNGSSSESSGAVLNAVSQIVSLQKAGVLPISTLAQLFESISNTMNSSYSEDDQKQVARYSAFGLTF